MDSLKALRDVIDEVDDQIMSLLNKRFDISNKIGSVKSNSKKDILDIKREEYVLNKIKKYSHSPQIELVYRVIMSESKNIQRR